MGEKTREKQSQSFRGKLASWRRSPISSLEQRNFGAVVVSAIVTLITGLGIYQINIIVQTSRGNQIILKSVEHESQMLLEENRDIVANQHVIIYNQMGLCHRFHIVCEKPSN